MVIYLLVSLLELDVTFQMIGFVGRSSRLFNGYRGHNWHELCGNRCCQSAELKTEKAMVLFLM